MTTLAVESRLGSLSSYTLPTDSYDSTKLGLSGLIRQYTGAGDEDKWAGPLKIGIARPVETAGAVPAQYPWAMQWSDTIDWLFFSDPAAVAATRRIQMYTFDRTTSLFSWNGSITCGFPYAGTQGTYTVNGFRMTYDKYTTGTAAVSGTTVTGTLTTWQASGIATGSRIGFGSTTPSAISTWYDISAISSDTSITLGASAGTVPDGAYVIEELRAVMSMTNGVTATNGGLFVVKGLQPAAFTSGSQSIVAATNTDNIRAVYWLKDAATNTNNAPYGVALESQTSWTSHNAYVINTVANPVVYKYNIRAALTVVSGAATNALVLISGAGGAVSGTSAVTNNVRLATLSHGNGAGQACLYFATTTRLYRTIAASSITAASTSWLPDAMVELAPGKGATFAASATLRNVEVMTQIDRLIIPTALRVYITKYLTDGTSMERICLANTLQLNQASMSSDAPPFPVASVAYNIDNVNGISYMVGVGTTAITNIIYAVPLSADWEYASASGHRLILPKFTTTGCTSFGTAYVNKVEVLGGKTGNNLGISTEAVRLLYRTSGIDDNSGGWTVINYSGNLSGITPSDEIQLAVEFCTIGDMCIPARVTSVGLTYNDGSTDSHYQPSVANSSIAEKRFAWRFATAFGTTVPRLRIRLYNAVTGDGPLVDDDSTTQVGTWEKSTDGGSNWVAWTNADKGNEITYLRFTPASLGDDIRVRAMLSLY